MINTSQQKLDFGRSDQPAMESDGYPSANFVACQVQSLNSLFFPPHIGAEPGRSRITCMRMLRTYQSKITRPS